MKGHVWRAVVVALLIAAVVALVQVKASKTTRSSSAGRVPAPVSQPPPEKPTEVAALPRLLELGADTCIPCKMMQPILAELRKEYAGKLEVEFVDVWKDPAAGRMYRVTVIPTQVFFDREGREVFRHVGFYPKEEILAKFKELGIEL